MGVVSPHAGELVSYLEQQVPLREAGRVHVVSVRSG